MNETIKELPATAPHQAGRNAIDGESWAALHGRLPPKGPCAPFCDLDDGVVSIGVAVVLLLRKVG